VSELCFVNDEVTCDVCSVGHFRHVEMAECMCNKAAAVDEVLATVTGVLIDGTRPVVVPLYV